MSARFLPPNSQCQGFELHPKKIEVLTPKNKKEKSKLEKKVDTDGEASLFDVVLSDTILFPEGEMTLLIVILTKGQDVVGGQML